MNNALEPKSSLVSGWSCQAQVVVWATLRCSQFSSHAYTQCVFFTPFDLVLIKSL